MNKDFKKWNKEKKVIHRQAKAAPLQSGLAVYLPPGRLSPNLTSGLGTWETLLGFTKFGVDFLSIVPYRLKNPSFASGSAKDKSMYEKHRIYSITPFNYVQSFFIHKTKTLKTKNSCAKARVFGVDRGGVEPLEQGGNPAPETARTRPSCPRPDHIMGYIEKQKNPRKGSLGGQTTSIKAGSPPSFKYTPRHFFVKSIVHRSARLAFFAPLLLLCIPSPAHAGITIKQTASPSLNAGLVGYWSFDEGQLKF